MVAIAPMNVVAASRSRREATCEIAVWAHNYLFEEKSINDASR
jgi:hypothetical protein